MRRAAMIGAVLLALASFAWLYVPWASSSDLAEDTAYTVPSGATLTSVASDLEQRGAIGDADGFLLRAKIFASADSIQAGEFLLPGGASASDILDILQHGDAIRRSITIPEGMPSILVYEALMAEPLLTGALEVPPEGSVLPNTYDFERGEPREAVMARMQAAMGRAIDELWPTRTSRSVVNSPKEALVLASIVEKETGKPSERRMVAGLYSNRLREGMFLQADPTIIYPLTKGKPLGRRILRSEIAAINDYNTYSMPGLPRGPITNPGRESIAAVLDPAETGALFMVADGTGGHEFNDTLDEHNAAVERWFAIRRARGEM